MWAVQPFHNWMKASTATLMTMSFPAAGMSFPGRQPVQLRHVGTVVLRRVGQEVVSHCPTPWNIFFRECVRKRMGWTCVWRGMWVPVHYCIPDHPFWVPAFRLQTNFDPPLDTLHTHTHTLFPNTNSELIIYPKFSSFLPISRATLIKPKNVKHTTRPACHFQIRPPSLYQDYI